MLASQRIAGLAFFLAAGSALQAIALDPSDTSVAKAPSNADVEFFEREVRPLLVERCHRCHGERKQEAALRLDTRSGLLQGSDRGPVIDPGSPDSSRLLEVIGYAGEVRMPPDGKLPAEEIEVLTKWIRLGALWPEEGLGGSGVEPFDLEKRRREHWAWHPVSDPPVPDVERSAWPRDPLDSFILARLESVGIEPAAEADRRTWLRRVTYDLIGLPPTPEEIDAFLADRSPDAYERVVDRLLTSQHFGERWARHWMDLVRYAETHGHEFDYPIAGAWRYRDYLIRAFNTDVPYEQFVREHIAGDLLQKPRRHPVDGFNESIIGTAFWWLGEATHAPTDVRGDEAGRIDNQIDVFTKTFLGLTIACARCHDHKFDAISTEDYYALAGFLQSSRRQVATLDRQRSQQKLADAAADLQRRRTELLRDIVDRGASAGELEQRFGRFLKAALEVGASPDPSDDHHDLQQERQAYQTHIKEVARAYGLRPQTVRRWSRALFRGDLTNVAHPLYVLRHVARSSDTEAVAEASAELHAAQSAWEEYEGESQLFADFDAATDHAWRTTGWAFGEGPTCGGAWEAAAEGTAAVPGGVADSGRLHRKLHGVLRSPTFTIGHDAIHYRVRGKDAKIRLVVDGYFMNQFSALLFEDFILDVSAPEDFAWQVQAGDVQRYRGHRAYIELEDAGDGYLAVDEIRFSNRRDKPPSRPSRLATALANELSTAPVEAVLHRHAAALAESVREFKRGNATDDQAQRITWLLENRLLEDFNDERYAATEAVADLQHRVEQMASEMTPPVQVVAMAEGSAENERVHIRGNHRALGDVVPRRLPEALGGERPGEDEAGSGRLLLARRVASSENPFTARVLVNRVWHHLTGRGIVAAVDNFGAMERPPTHPELRDHLATRFVRDDWSVKRLIRAIVLSSTYRMASTPTESGRQLDPANDLLHAMRIRRLEGEAIRDAILAVSGRLDRTLYGPSVPVHITEFMTGRGRPESGPLDGDRRRSLYISVNRNFLSPMMLAFDTPIPFTTIGRRNVSNVPAQALILLNDPFVAGEAHKWAERLLKESDQPPVERIEQMYVEAFGRPPTERELQVGLRFISQHAERYGPDANAEPDGVRVWADFAHVLLNTKEFILVY